MRKVKKQQKSNLKMFKSMQIPNPELLYGGGGDDQGGGDGSGKAKKPPKVVIG